MAYKSLSETVAAELESVILELWKVDETTYGTCDTDACEDRGYIHIYGNRYCLQHAATGLRLLDANNSGLSYQTHVAVDIARPADPTPPVFGTSADQLSQLREAFTTALRVLGSIADRGSGPQVTKAQWNSALTAVNQLQGAEEVLAALQRGQQS